MKKLSRKTLTLLTASVLACNCMLCYSFSTSAAGAQKYEFEDGTPVGATIQENGTERWQEGASGDKFVFLENGGETATVNVSVESTGMYNVTIRYAAPFGDKLHNLLVNGVDQGQFSCSETAANEWADVSCGTVKLNAGENEITVKSSWGWTDIDYLTIEEASLPDISASQTTCCDPSATSQAQSLMSYMASVYGEHIISGQQEIYKYGPHDFPYEFDYIKDTTGKLPAIRGFDYLNCNPLYGSEDGTTNRIIEWVNNNPYDSSKQGIATASWHITVPKNFSSYTLGDSVAWADATYVPKETDFDTSKAIVEGTKEYEYYMLCLKNLAAELQKLQDANVPLIFRPLHEAEGGGGETGSWFWWGKSGSKVYKELWKLTYKTLTEEYGLHNLIWEWNSYAYETSADWYPGDEYVDLIAYDKYNCTDWSSGSAVLNHNDSAISSTFYSIMQKYDSKKMVAMSENDSIPTVGNLTAEKAGWLYFCPWYDGGSDSTNFLTNELFNKKDDLIEMYQSDYCITLDELPDDLYSNGGTITTKPTTTSDGSETTTTTKTTTTTSQTTEGIHAKITEDSGNYNISFAPKSMGKTVYLVFEANSNVAFANGCLGVSATVDGTDYWVSYKWEISKSGTISVDLDKDVYNITYNNGKDTVTDEDLIAKIVEVVKKQTDGMVQIWWANDGPGESIATSNVVLTDAYLPESKEEVTTEETTEATTTTTLEETTTSVEVTTTTSESGETTTTAVETSDTSKESETTTETTTSEVVVNPTDVFYGDVNLDGSVDLADAVLLNKAVAGTVELNATAKANADCDSNGTVTADDSMTLLKFLVHLINELPAK